MSTLKVNTLQTNTGSGFNIDSPLESIPSIDVTGGAVFGAGINVTGISTLGNATASTLNVSGVSTFTTVKVGTAATIDSSGVQVGAGKSVRIFGSTSGFSDIIASSAAGASELLLPNTSGTLDRLNRQWNLLQVVNGSYSTQVTSTSTSFADTGLSASITLTASTSKILVLISQQLIITSPVSFSTYYRTSAGVIVLRNSTQISNNSNADSGGRYGFHVSSSVSTGVWSSYWKGMFLDTPGAGTHTYKTQFAVGLAGNTAYAQAAGTQEQSTITLLEVAA